jgi:Gas vesicle synthesis protein GvpL/GvpF
LPPRAVPTYLYGLILQRNAARVPADLTGLGDAPVRLLPCGDAAAIVSDASGPPRSADLGAIRAHDRVLRAVARHAITVAAVRFGQQFSSDVDLCREVVSRTSTTLALLEDHDGLMEMRLLLPDEAMPEADAPTPEVGPGRAYLESLRRTHAVPGLSLRDALGPVVRAERVERLREAGGVAFAHLVRAEDGARYREAVASLPALAEAKVIGPLPLYSFGEADE